MSPLAVRILDSLEDRISVLDASGEIVAVNRAWRAFARDHGLSPEAGGESGNYLRACDRAVEDASDTPARVAQGIRRVLSGELEQFLCRYPCPDDQQERWFQVRVTPLHGAGAPHAVVLHEDITLRHQAERSLEHRERQGRVLAGQLTRARNSAEQANQAKSAFLASMSHELRTPLNAVMGFAQLLEMDPEADPRESAVEILRAGRHMQGVLDEVLDLSRIEEGRVDLNLEPVSLCRLVRDCLALEQPAAAQGQISLGHTEPDGSDLWVWADTLRLRQVLINLISNGIKYNLPGGRVEVACRALAGGRVEIAVSDTGLGIPEARRAELFSPFNRLGREGSGIEGTGLGLAISRHLVSLMGGEIQVFSVPKGGSTFRVVLPEAERGTQGEVSVPAEDTRAPLTRASGWQRTVCYVEDNPANLRLVEQLLARRRDIRFLGIEHPRACRETVLREVPDLIMLDINLPEISGHELLDLLRRESTLDGIPIIAISANAMPHEVARGLDAGFDRYLTKPLDIPRFMQTLDELL